MAQSSPEKKQKVHATQAKDNATISGLKDMKPGRMIVFEGLDRSGKTTQLNLLAEKMKQAKIPHKIYKFPDRTSVTGKMLDAYLKSTSDSKLNPTALHFIFAANRWEHADAMRRDLESGIHLLVDRYTDSGIAYAMAQGVAKDVAERMIVGLTKPDITFYLKLEAKDASKRGNFGQERMETNEIQTAVGKWFVQKEQSNVIGSELDAWHLDATLSIEQLHSAIWELVTVWI